MLVKATESIKADGLFLQPGAVFEIDDETGYHLIDRGLAISQVAADEPTHSEQGPDQGHEDPGAALETAAPDPTPTKAASKAKGKTPGKKAKG